jgi:single-stranded-DNA-specific exonuclease
LCAASSKRLSAVKLITDQRFFFKSGDKYAASVFDVYNALEACSQHLEQFGGHVCRGNDFERRKLFKEAFDKKVKQYFQIDIDVK